MSKKNQEVQNEVEATNEVHTARKAYSVEQVAEIKRRRDERNAATNTLISLVLTTGIDGSITKEMLELAALAAPKNGGGGSSSTGSKKSVMNMVKDLFDDKAIGQVIDEVTIFNELKLGRSEMAKNIKLLIKNFTPETRTWIQFNAEDGEYEVVARGASAPIGWTGYIPVEEIVNIETDVEAGTDDDQEAADSEY